MQGESVIFSASAEEARTMRKQLHAARWEAERQRCYTQHRQQRKLAKETWRHVRRHVLCVSKAKVARICGVSRGTVDRWEDPRSWSLPDVAHIGILQSILGGEMMYGYLYSLCGVRSVMDHGQTGRP